MSDTKAGRYALKLASIWPAVGYANIETWAGSGASRSAGESNPLNDGSSDTTQLVISGDGVHDLSARWLVTDAIILRSPVVQGDLYTAVDETVAIADMDGDGSPDSVHAVVTVLIVGNEALNVEGGTFSSALKVVTSATLTGMGTRVGATAPVSLVSTDWYAPVIGRIKTEFFDGSFPSGYLGKVVTEELAGYRDATTAFGYLPNTTLFADRPLDYPKSPPAVDSNESGYLVALSQGQWVYSNSLSDGGPVIGTLVGNDGGAGPSLTLIDSAQHGGVSPAVVGAEGGFLVVVGDRTRLMAQRVTSTGVMLDGPSGVAVYSGPNGVYAPSLARLGNRILLSWTEGTEQDDGTMINRAMLLDARTGQPVSQPVTIVSPTGYAGYPRVAAGTNGYLLVFSGWADRYNFFLARAYPATLFASRIDTGGQLLDAQPVALSEAGTAHSVADVRAQGGEYVVTWADNRNHLLADHRGVYPPQDAYTGTFMQDVFVTKLTQATGAVAIPFAPTGASTTGVNAYRDSPAMAIAGNQAVEAHNVFGSGAAAGVYFRWLEPGLSSASAAATVPDNVYAMETLPTYTYPYGNFGQTQAATNGRSALITFLGLPPSGQKGAVRAALILPRALR